MAESWSREELAASVEAYMDMLTKEQANEPFVKKHYYRQLADRFSRTEKSIEFRMQNISHVLDAMKKSWISGLKPATNVGANNFEVIEQLIRAHPEQSPQLTTAPITSHSWFIDGFNEAVKIVDETLIKELRTGVPLDVVQFFSDEPLEPKQVTGITAQAKDKYYHIELTRNQSGRHILKLADLDKALNLSALSVGDKVFFELDEEQGCLVVSTLCQEPTASTRPPTRNERKLGKPSKTTRISNTKQRVGQGYFRESVRQICSNTCMVTGVQDLFPSILIASHIKPWEVSNDEEKLDGHNGLLLAPHIDKLFDRYYISFDDKGSMLTSPEVEEVLCSWGIDRAKKYSFTESQHRYMNHHRSEFKKRLG